MSDGIVYKINFQENYDISDDTYHIVMLPIYSIKSHSSGVGVLFCVFATVLLINVKQSSLFFDQSNQKS